MGGFINLMAYLCLVTSGVVEELFYLTIGKLVIRFIFARGTRKQAPRDYFRNATHETPQTKPQIRSRPANQLFQRLFGPKGLIYMSLEKDKRQGQQDYSSGKNEAHKNQRSYHYSPRHYSGNGTGWEYYHGEQGEHKYQDSQPEKAMAGVIS